MKGTRQKKKKDNAIIFLQHSLNAVEAFCGACSGFCVAPGAPAGQGGERRPGSLLRPSRGKAAFAARGSFSGTKGLCKGHKSPEINWVVTRWGEKR